MFYIGITVGRAINGFLTFKINDVNLIRIGEGIILAGVITLFLPFNATVSFIGLLLIGLGCAPIYPSIIHSTPEHFGADKSQAIVGVQMASAYVGSCLMPPLFGLIADNINVNLLPLFLLIVLLSMILVHGENFQVGNKVFIDLLGTVIVKDNVTLKDNVSISGNVLINSNVTIENNVSLFATDHELYYKKRRVNFNLAHGMHE